MDFQLLSMIEWVLAASIFGFAISAVFSGRLKLSRRRFLIPYVLIVSLFLYTFISLNKIDGFAILTDHWVWGILAGGLVSIFLVRTVRSQPASRLSSGAELAVDLGWAGLVYGIVDALFLNIMPVVAIGMGFSQFGWAETTAGKIGIGVAGLFASLLVTLAYHLGYMEFRNKRVSLVLVGNTIITLAFILTGSPLGSLISHTVMHLAAVWQGSETTIQLPPHYYPRIEEK